MAITISMEIWKDIKGYEGHYQVSNLGRVKSLDIKYYTNLKQGRTECVRKGMILKNQQGPKYLQVGLKRKTHTIHKLVMMAFIGDKPDGLVIDHKDNNPLNNNLDNLAYTTYQINNTKDRTFTTTKERGVHFCKTKNKWVCRITVNKKRKYLGTFLTEQEAIKIINEYDNNK